MLGATAHSSPCLCDRPWWPPLWLPADTYAYRGSESTCTLQGTGELPSAAVEQGRLAGSALGNRTAGKPHKFHKRINLKP